MLGLLILGLFLFAATARKPGIAPLSGKVDAWPLAPYIALRKGAHYFFAMPWTPGQVPDGTKIGVALTTAGWDSPAVYPAGADLSKVPLPYPAAWHDAPANFVRVAATWNGVLGQPIDVSYLQPLGLDTSLGGPRSQLWIPTDEYVTTVTGGPS